MSFAENFFVLMMKKIFTFLMIIFLPLSLYGAPLPKILSESDAQIYTDIFTLQNKEKMDSASVLEKQISDRLLMNEVLYQRYISKTYHTHGKEITEWMAKYYDMPGAVRMEKLAKIKNAKVRKPKVPAMVSGGESIETAQSETWTVRKYAGETGKKINKFKRAIRNGSTKIARRILEEKSFQNKLTKGDYGRLAGRLAYIYYTNGEFELAKKWGLLASDANSEYGLWTMGLLSFKAEQYKDSQNYFSKILELEQINNARKTEAAFWAGRAANAIGDTISAHNYWAIAAAHPMAFYGALATAMLGEKPNYEFFEQEYTEEDLNELSQTKYGKIALALLQIGQKNRAEEYLKYMITSHISDRTLHAINCVASVYSLPRVSIQASGLVQDRGILEIDNDIIYSAQYPLPDWEPVGGWSIDRALLLAITKQESGFKINAKSNAGANGLMQIMPNTAKRVARKNKVNLSKIDMSKPEDNMFLGQQYITDLFSNPNINNNIIKMLTAYNAGMGNLVKFEKSFETYDPLLYIESFPAYETRNYVKRVMSNLWLYRAKLNQPLTSLKELANSKWPLYTSEDDYVQQQIADRAEI